MDIESHFQRYIGFNGRHSGDTVFVVGSGPQLAQLEPRQITELEKKLTIGVNLTFYRLKPMYFLSAYIGQVALAKHVVPESNLLHMRPMFEPPLLDGIIPLRRKIFNKTYGLKSSFSPPEPVLFTKQNVVLGATHLAFILGAKRIVYIGVEQRNQLHYWHFDRAMQNRIRQDIEILKDIPFLNIDHPYATYEGQVAKMEKLPEDCQEPFYKFSHEQTFRDYFDCLNFAGVEVISTTLDSVICDAGADYVPLDKVLA